MMMTHYSIEKNYIQSDEDETKDIHPYLNTNIKLFSQFFLFLFFGTSDVIDKVFNVYSYDVLLEV